MNKTEGGTIVTDVPAQGEGTIVTDVPSDEERVAQSPRMALMSQIRVDRQDVEAEGFGAEAAAVAPVAARDDAGKVVDPAEGLKAAPDAMVEVLVHGVARLVPVSEVVKGYQIESVARENLRKASETLKDAERIKSAAIPAAVPAATPVNAESLKGALDLMVEGETGEAAKVLAGLLAAPVVQQPLDVQGEVKKALKADEAGKVYDKFLGDYKELADPDVYGVCDKIYEREFLPLVESGELSFDEGLRKAGDATRAKFNFKAEEVKADPVEIPAVVTGRAATVAANKAKIVNIPTAGGRLPAASADKPKSTADVIQEMRARRGLS